MSGCWTISSRVISASLRLAATRWRSDRAAMPANWSPDFSSLALANNSRRSQKSKRSIMMASGTTFAEWHHGTEKGHRKSMNDEQKVNQKGFSNWTLRLEGRLRFVFLQQHYIGIGMRAQYSQVLAVGRPVEICHLLGVEVRDLMAGGTIQRLKPNIVHPIFAYRVSQSFPVGSELETAVRQACSG